MTLVAKIKAMDATAMDVIVRCLTKFGLKEADRAALTQPDGLWLDTLAGKAWFRYTGGERTSDLHGLIPGTLAVRFGNLALAQAVNAELNVLDVARLCPYSGKYNFMRMDAIGNAQCAVWLAKLVIPQLSAARRHELFERLFAAEHRDFRGVLPDGTKSVLGWAVFNPGGTCLHTEGSMPVVELLTRVAAQDRVKRQRAA